MEMKKVLILLAVALIVAGSAVAATSAKNKKETTANKEAVSQKPVEIVIVADPEYTAGQEDPQLTAGLAQYLKATPSVKVLSVQEAAADEEISKISYDFLPLYLIKKTDEVREKFAEPISMGYLQESENYVILAHQTRTGVYANKKAKPNVMELFVMSQCPYGVMAENLIIQAKKDGKLPNGKDIKIRYIVSYDDQKGFSSLHGSGEWEENVRQLLIAKYYPEKLWKYLEIRNKDYRSSRWDKAMEAAGINVSKISKKFDTEGLELLKAEAAYGNEYGVSGSPTFLWEGKVQMDLGSASKIPGFEFLNPNAARAGAQVAAPTGSC